MLSLLSILMSENKVTLVAASNTISLDANTKYYIYRENNRDSPIYLEEKNSHRREMIHPGNSLVSGKSSSRGSEGIPYLIEVQEDRTVKFKVFNATNPVGVGSRTTKNSPEGIAIGDEGSAKFVRIGDSSRDLDSNDGIIIQIQIPEKSQNDQEHQAKKESNDSISTDETNKEEKGRKINKRVLNMVKNSVDEVYRNHSDVPTIGDLEEQMYENNLNVEREDLVIYEEDGKQYTVADIAEAIWRLSNIRKEIPVDEAHQVSARTEWEEGLKNYITSEGNLRSKIGNLYLYNENNNVVIGGQQASREERIDKIVD